MANEIELKLAIAPADIPLLKRHPLLAAASAKPVTRKLLSIYYDTPQLTLHDLRTSLRVRRMSGQWFQAVKSAGSSLAGLHQRLEWEDIIAFDHPDFSKITEPALTRIFDDETLRQALAPIFRTEVHRTEWLLDFDNGDQVEVALDVGHLVVVDVREPICEIELELKAGAPGRLFELALALQQSVPVTLENVSKAQRGYAHYRPQPPRVIRARRTRLSPAMPGHAALRQIGWECLTHLQGNQEMVLLGDDIEGVHQMRVALRRLRSALSVFRVIAGREHCAPIVQELCWLTDILGRARDLDVFLAQTLPPMLAPLQQHPGLLQLKIKAEAARIDAYRQAREALRSQRYQRMLLSLGGWLENQDWQMSESAQVSVAEIARSVLDKRHRQLRRHGKRLLHMHPEERHATRIAAKKLRYAAEFFVSLYPDTKTSKFLPALSELLDILGVLNDIAVTHNLIREVIGNSRSRALDESLHLFSGWNACHAMHRLQGLEPAWRRFARSTPFWEA